MKPRSFAGFVAPTVLLMLALLALPMVMTLVLSVRDARRGRCGQHHHPAHHPGGAIPKADRLRPDPRRRQGLKP